MLVEDRVGDPRLLLRPHGAAHAQRNAHERVLHRIETAGTSRALDGSSRAVGYISLPTDREYANGDNRLTPPPPNPEQQAREQIDAVLNSAGWVVQNRDGIDLYANRGVAVREYPLKPEHGFVDYLLVDGQKVLAVIGARVRHLAFGAH